MNRIILSFFLAIISLATNAQAPTTPSSNLVIRGIDGNQITISFTKGDGDKRLIIAKAGSPVTATPVDGVDYLAGSFGAGNEIAPGEFVVYEGIGNSYIYISGLNHSTTYYFKVFEFNGGSSTTEYLTSSFLEGSETTLTYPNSQAKDIAFSNILGERMTVSWTNGDGTGRILIGREGSPVDVEPVNLINYPYTAGAMGYASYEIGNGNYVLYSSTGSSVNITNLKPNTTYHFALFEYNGNSGKVYLTSTSSTPTPGATASQLTATYPTVNTASVWFDAPQVDYLRARVTGYGNGARRIMVVKKGGPVDALPVDGADYFPSTTFGSGSNLGNGNYVVYDGTAGNYTHISGLEPNTTYHVKIFEYNGTGTNTAYLTGIDSNGNPPPESSLSTLTHPTVQAKDISFSNVLGERMTVNWTNGDGSGRILIARAGSPVDVEPTDLNNYSYNAGGMGNAFYEIGSGNYVLYNSSGSSVNISNLNSNTTYYFALFEFNGSSNSKLYLTSQSPNPTPGATASQQTTAYPTINTASVFFDNPQVDYLRLRMSSYGNGARRIVVIKKDNPVDALPVDGQDYTPNTTFGFGSNLGNGNYVVYDGTGGNYTHIYGLEPNTTYHVKVFEYNGTGTETFYLTGIDSNGNPPPTASRPTLSTPTIQAKDIVFSNVLGERMTVSWTKGNGSGRILIASEDRAVDVEPTDLTRYSANAGGMGNAGYQIGIGNYVLYDGAGTSVNITNLNPNTTYYFSLFEYNGVGSSKLYLTSQSPIPSPGAIASQLTPAYPTLNSQNLYFDAIDANSLRIRFPYNGYGNGARRLIVAKKDSPVDGLPVDGQEYSANSTFGSGSDLGNESFVVYNGTGGNYSYINGIDYATNYYIKVFEYNGSGTETFYLRNADENGVLPAEISQSTTNYPTTQASNILFSNVADGKMTLNWTNGSGSGRILIARAGNPVDTEPTDLINYGYSGGGFGNPSFEIGTGNYVLYSGNASQVNLSNLNGNVTYYFALFEYSGSSKKLYLTSQSPVPTPGATASRYLGTPPTLNATDLNFRAIDGNQFSYYFSPGGGDNRMVVAREGGPVNAVPVDDLNYTANATFGLGDDLGGGNYVIYNGNSKSSGTITGLKHSTTYYLQVFEYNGTGNETYYLTVSDLNNNPPVQGSQATKTYPSTQASNIYFTNVSGSAMKVNWARGDGEGRILIGRKGSPVDAEPTVLENYIASGNAMGNTSYEIGSGNYVLYSGTGQYVNLSDLELNTNYHFALFEYNGFDGKVYLTSSSPNSQAGATANQTTTTYPSYSATGLTFTQIDGNRFTYSLIKGDGTHRIVIAKEGSPVDFVPIDGEDYTADITFGAGQELGNGNFVVYNETGSKSNIAGLNPSTTYYLKVFEYNKQDIQTYYLVSSFAQGNQTTLSPPTIQASNAFVHEKTSTSIKLSWTEGNGYGSLLVAKADAPVDVDPVDLTNYSASRRAMGNAYYEIGNGNYVLFSGSISGTLENSINIENLSPNVNYHFALFEYTGDFGKQYLTPAYTFQEQTWGLRPTVQASNAFFEDGATSMNVKFQRGDGLFTLVLGKVGSPVDAEPADFTSYNSFGFIPEAEIGNGNYVLHDSKNGGAEFDLFNLNQDETYHFAFFEYAISEAGELYLTPGYAGSQSTSTPPTLLPTNLTVDPPCGNNVQVTWDIDLQDANTGDGRLVVLSKEPLNATPISTVNYIADFDYGEGSAIGNGFVVYKGSGVLFPPNLLEANTNYYINLFEYNGVDTDPAFNTTPVQGLIGDNTPPEIICKNITVQLDANGQASIVPEDLDNGATDNCTLEILSLDKTDFTCDDLGTNIVTLTATDSYGNTSSCTAEVIVEDNILPTIGAVVDINTASSINGPEACEATVIIPDVTVDDNCQSTLTWQMTGADTASGQGQIGSYTFPVGSTEITYVNTDVAGNFATKTMNVNVADDQLPVIIGLPTNISVDNDASACGAIATWAAPTSFDNCSASSVQQTSGLPSGSVFPIGVTTITYTATDASLNSYSESFDVIVTDSENPVISDVTNFTVNPEFECDFTIPDYTTLVTASDNCGIASITQEPSFGTVISGHGTKQVITLTAQDVNENISSTTFQITLEGTETFYADLDGDGYGDTNNSITSCSLPAGYVIDNTDCDDNNPAVNPGALEICDGIDNNCDGNIDEGVGISFYADADGDGYGDASNSIVTCSAPAGYVIDNTDCDDTDANINPGATEILYNGIDDDCDPTTADGIDADGDGYDSNVDCDDTNPEVNPEAIEICDGIDNDCDGNIDEGVGISFYADADGDGYGDASNSIVTCSAPAGYVIDNTDCDDTDANINPGATEILYNGIDDDCDPTTADGIDADGDGYDSNVDCDDTNPEVNPGALEICDGIDNDCDGNIDEGVGISFFADADGDGYGDASNSIVTCSAPDGYVIDNTDCDDTDANINPGATEILYNGIDDDCDPTTADGIDADGDGYESNVDCDDTNPEVNPEAIEICDGIDNNCDGNIDEGVGISFYADADGDGYGDASNSIVTCSAPAGYVIDNTDCDDTDANINPGATEILYNGIDDDCDPTTADGIDADGDGYDSNVDCDDTNPEVNPGALEICDGIDNDCDGNIDEGVGISFFADADGDGYGDASNSIVTCSAPDGYVIDNTDCDDTDANINPGATEILYNGIDDDCDPTTADGIDADGDGYESNVDCDDTNPEVNPGAIEICDGIDNNCDGNIDEGVGISFFADADGDGYGDASNSIVTCSAPDGYVIDNTDCDDTDANINPGATEIPNNGIDEDCDGQDATLNLDADNDGVLDDQDNCPLVANPGQEDLDGDGIGDVCDDDADGDNVLASDDCDDFDNQIGGKKTWYADIDGDGFGDYANSTLACAQPQNYVSNSDDCDDSQANVYPGAVEVCDGIDNNCDGNVDENIQAVPGIASLSLPLDPVELGTEISAIAGYSGVDPAHITFEWGDGQTSHGAIVDGSIKASHVYGSPGVYTVKLTVADNCGNEDSRIYQYVVIYDPTGGFVTGGGWIWSAPGNYLEDPSLEGKANFGFVAKYKKGANVPVGNTVFKFKAGDLNFKSTSYEWLVIAGQKAKYKGAGTINGSGNYKFMLSAIDGDSKTSADKFRIKIWSDQGVIYDNQPGENDDADATTNISGGSITIHKGKNRNARIAALTEEEVLIDNTIGLYPNPFSESVNISFELLENAFLTVRIFDLSGKFAYTLKDGVLEKGRHSFKWDGTNESGNMVSNGVYIVHIKNRNGYESMKRIIFNAEQ